MTESFHTKAKVRTRFSLCKSLMSTFRLAHIPGCIHPLPEDDLWGSGASKKGRKKNNSAIAAEVAEQGPYSS